MMLLDLAVTFWQWSIFVALVIIGYVFSRFDGQGEERVGFKINENMPKMMPIPIATKDKGFWKGIFLWLLTVRQWEIYEDFYFTLEGEDYKIPKGFQFDGASVPKFLAMWLSPTGVLLMGVIVMVLVTAVLLLAPKLSESASVTVQLIVLLPAAIVGSSLVE